jgi:hypothetical protein
MYPVFSACRRIETKALVFAARATDSFEAWLLQVEGYGEFAKFSPEGNSRARKLYEAASETDPKSVLSQGWMATPYCRNETRLTISRLPLSAPDHFARSMALRAIHVEFTRG